MSMIQFSVALNMLSTSSSGMLFSTSKMTFNYIFSFLTLHLFLMLLHFLFILVFHRVTLKCLFIYGIHNFHRFTYLNFQVDTLFSLS